MPVIFQGAHQHHVEEKGWRSKLRRQNAHLADLYKWGKVHATVRVCWGDWRREQTGEHSTSSQISLKARSVSADVAGSPLDVNRYIASPEGNQQRNFWCQPGFNFFRLLATINWMQCPVHSSWDLDWHARLTISTTNLNLQNWTEKRKKEKARFQQTSGCLTLHLGLGEWQSKPS